MDIGFVDQVITFYEPEEPRHDEYIKFPTHISYTSPNKSRGVRRDKI